MRISNSKKQLAKIIHENGGWRDGAGFAAQDQNAYVTFFVDAPWRCETSWEASEFEALSGFGVIAKSLPNWHQTILSCDEYFHLYPAPDADFPSGDGFTDDTDALQRLLDRSRRAPTIEQLASDYKAKMEIAQKAQEEADSHRCGAEAALKLLELAGAELGLVISVCETPKQEAELNITDWRDLQIGDEVECVGYDEFHRFGAVGYIDRESKDQQVKVVHDNGDISWPIIWRFIRRP